MGGRGLQATTLCVDRDENGGKGDDTLLGGFGGGWALGVKMTPFRFHEDQDTGCRV